MPQIKPEIETFAKIRVLGVGGSGGSAVDRMVKSGIRGVDFVAVNTDVQALHHNSAATKLHIGKTVTRGLGAGMNPELGRMSAEETQNEIREILKDTDMVFVTCGLGGGTGSGAAPVVAQIARELGVLTIGVVTKPFTFEGPQRKEISEQAHRELAKNVDTIITIPNDRILQIIDKKTSLLDAFKIVDDVLRQGVQGISELITVPGLINVDFADVKTIMSDTGSALMGIGVGTGDNRATEAAKAAISSPLLDLSIDGARGILFTITGGSSLAMQEVAEAAKVITSSADENAKVIFGAVVDDNMGEDVRITVIATGFDERGKEKLKPVAVVDSKKHTFHSNIFNKKLSEGRNIDSENDDNEEEEEEESFNEEEKQNQFVKRSVNPIVKMDPISSMGSSKNENRMENIVSQNKKNVQSSSGDSEEEDLEIPAFIRKKMGM